MPETVAWHAILLSVKVASIATLIALPLGFLTACLLAYVRFRGKILLEVLVNLPLALPPVVVGYLLLTLLAPSHGFGAFLEKVSLNPLFTWRAAVLASMAVGFPLMVRTIRLNLMQIDPRVVYAARTLGASPWKTLWKIIIPLALPGIGAGAMMMFIRSLGEFGATIILAGNIPGVTQTLSLAIYDAANTPNAGGEAMVLSLASIIIAFGVLLLHEHLLMQAKKGAIS